MLTPADRELAKDMARWYADPLGFVMYAFPWKRPGLLAKYDGPDDWQRDFLIQLGAEVKVRAFDGHTPVNPIRMTRASGHGIGKSTLSAWITLWIMSTRPRSKGTVTANTAYQLSTKTWAQLQYWLKLCITRHWFEISTEKMWARDQKEAWFVSAASHEEKNSEAFAGQHAHDASSFYVFDESSGISDKIYDVAEGGLTDGEPMEFLFGNPTQNSGRFYRVNFGSERNGWNHASIDSRTSRFTNKAVIAEWAERYGEDSDWFRYRVKGEAPRVGFSAFIPPDAVEACRKFKAQGYASMPKIMAVDVARYGDDRSIIGIRQGRQYRVLGKYRSLDLVQLSDKIIPFIESEEPDATVVDGDGLGAGVIDILKHRGYSKRVHEFHGGATAADSAMYYNVRTEVWGWMRDWLKAGAEIPDDPELAVDLTTPGYDTARGKRFHGSIQLEHKDDLKARGEASPDDGDTLAMTFAVKVAAKSRPAPELRYSFPGQDALRWLSS
jgi:hypothetical protein